MSTQSIAYLSPGSQELDNDLISGYKPPNRIGEIVVNAFTDPTLHKFAQLACEVTQDINEYPYPSPSLEDYLNKLRAQNKSGQALDPVIPPMHVWSTALPGMIALSCRSGTNTYFTSADEPACPVIVSAAGLAKSVEPHFQFAGVVRSPSVKGTTAYHSADDYFTLSIAGVVGILNNSSSVIYYGDHIAWSLFFDAGHYVPSDGSMTARKVQIIKALPGSSNPNVFGVAQHKAMPGQSLDVKLIV